MFLTQFIDKTTEEKWRANLRFQSAFLLLLVIVIKNVIAVRYANSYAFVFPRWIFYVFKHFLVETIYILYMSDSNLYPYPYTERGKIDDFSPFFQIKSPCIGQFWCFKVGAALLQTPKVQ